MKRSSQIALTFAASGGVLAYNVNMLRGAERELFSWVALLSYGIAFIILLKLHRAIPFILIYVHFGQYFGLYPQIMPFATASVWSIWVMWVIIGIAGGNNVTKNRISFGLITGALVILLLSKYTLLLHDYTAEVFVLVNALLAGGLVIGFAITGLGMWLIALALQSWSSEINHFSVFSISMVWFPLVMGILLIFYAYRRRTNAGLGDDF